MRRLMAALVAYLEMHPNAADNLYGIHQWWLSRSLLYSTADVARALAELRAQGKIEECPTQDGNNVFRAKRLRA